MYDAIKAIKVSCRLQDLASRTISPQAAFIMSRLESGATVSELPLLTGLNTHILAQELAELARQGAVELSYAAEAQVR